MNVKEQIGKILDAMHEGILNASHNSCLLDTMRETRNSLVELVESIDVLERE